MCPRDGLTNAINFIYGDGVVLILGQGTGGRKKEHNVKEIKTIPSVDIFCAITAQLQIAQGSAAADILADVDEVSVLWSSPLLCTVFPIILLF